MTEHDTSVLTARLHTLAEEMTPAVDVVGQVRSARQRHRRQRRARIAVLAVATAATALVAGTAVTVNVLSADRGTQVAAPSSPTPSTAALPAGWETRTFKGVDFAVPPGARSADTFLDVPVSSWTSGPTLIWNGPQLADDQYSSVSVMVADPFQGGLPPRGGGRSFTVPGAEKAYGNIETTTMTDGLGSAERVVVWLELLADNHLVQVDAVFDGGDAGRRTAQQLIDSLSVTGSVGAGVAPSDEESRAQDALQHARLAAGARSVSESLGAADGSWSLTAPADLTQCPADDGTVSAAVGQPLDYTAGNPLKGLGCQWTSGKKGGVPADFFSAGVGLMAGVTETEVRDGTPVGPNCRRDLLPAFSPTAFLDSCAVGDQNTQWTLYVPDAKGAGMWVFGVFQGGNQPVDGPAGLAAALHVAASTW